MTARTLLSGLFAIGLGLVGLGTAPAVAAEGERHVHDFSFSFEGPFGRYDQSQLQRGLQVYTEICSACHGLKFVAFRTLENEGGPALSEEAMRAYAAQHEVFDVALDDTRVATPTDFFPPSNVPNAPDLSLMAKARAGFHGPAGLGLNQILFGMGGPEYIASVVTGFTGEEKEEAGTTLYENTAFGGYMAMAPVLYGDDVTYADGTVATPEQIAQDVAAFLMWTAEPHLVERKRTGFMVGIFLLVFAGLMYLTKKRVWSGVAH